MSENSVDLVDKVAEKLGLAVAELKPLAATIVEEYSRANAWAMALSGVGILAMLGLGYGLIRFIRHLVKVQKGWDEPETVMLSLIGGLVSMFLIVSLVVTFVGCVMRCVAPHYYILKDLIG